jgi:hypothetical protein
MILIAGWPYAAKAVIQHEFWTDHLNIWLTFFFPMNQTVKPADTKWIVKCDNVEKPVSSSAWQDAWTLLLTVPNVSSNPDRVLVEYEGPGPETYDPTDPTRQTLEISWQKQWEGWGPILSMDIGT